MLIFQILQQAEVPLVSRDICQKANDDLLMTITERMRCAGYAGGGPLVGQKDNKWYPMGIVSWRVGCARENRYGVYALT